MRNIRRFQRTYFTLLLGINVLVFSYSYHQEFSVALGHCLMSMLCCGGLLIILAYFQKSGTSKRLLADRQHSSNPPQFPHI